MIFGPAAFSSLIVILSCSRSANAQISQPIFPLANPITLPGVGAPTPSLSATSTTMGSLTSPTSASAAVKRLSGSTGLRHHCADYRDPTLCVSRAGQPSFADVNNDKKLDLVSSRFGFLTIPLGNGDGTFQPPAPASCILRPYGGTPIFADLNGDGYIDIATLTFPANAPPQVSVFLNQVPRRLGLSQLPFCMRPRVGLKASRAATLTEMANRTWKPLSLQQDPVSRDPSRRHLLRFPSSTAMATGLHRTQDTVIAPFEGFTTGDFNGDGVTDFPSGWSPHPVACSLRYRFCWGATAKPSARAWRYPSQLPCPPQYPIRWPRLPSPIWESRSSGWHQCPERVPWRRQGRLYHRRSYGVYAQASEARHICSRNGDGNQDLIVASQASKSSSSWAVEATPFRHPLVRQFTVR